MVCGAAAVAAAVFATSGTQLVKSPVASAAPRPTATVDGAVDKDTGWKWFHKNIPSAYTAMNDGLQAWSVAMGAGNAPAMYQACGQIAAAGSRFERVLPAPDSRANFRLKGVADDLHSAADRCFELPAQANWDVAKPMLRYVDSAKARLKQAQAIMQPNG